MRIIERLVLTTCCTIASVGFSNAPLPASAAFDVLYQGPMYCIPGVTSQRCRGTFWETGTLYKKGQEGGVLTAEEYSSALQRMGELQKDVTALALRADEGERQDVGAGAAAVRAELRIIGQRVLRSAFMGDERIDAETRLRAVLASLDDVDRDAERETQASLPPGFGTLRLQLDAAAKRLEEFRRALPVEPDPDAY
jgi:hypothetical protein